MRAQAASRIPLRINRGESFEDIDQDGWRTSPRVINTIGTGRDGCGTFDLSTALATLASGAGAGNPKFRPTDSRHPHGNRALMSSSRSTDLLEAPGCPLSPPSTFTVSLVGSCDCGRWSVHHLMPTSHHRPRRLRSTRYTALILPYPHTTSQLLQ